MAEELYEKLVPNTLLCYVCTHISNSTKNELINTIHNYYTLEELVEAKQILHKIYSGIGAFKIRKDSPNRSEKIAHTDDIVNALYDLDQEGNDFQFVAKNVRRMPQWDPNVSDNFALAERLSNHDGKLMHVE
jgi:hypothetical protein